jgi:hypothetical protein
LEGGSCETTLLDVGHHGLLNSQDTCMQRSVR